MKSVFASVNDSLTIARLTGVTRQTVEEELTGRIRTRERVGKEKLNIP